MSEPSSPILRMPPRWLMIVGSVAILLHLGAVAVQALAAHSGPWVTDFGPSPAEPPHFAELANRVGGRYYLHPLHLSYHYHFSTNYPNLPDVYFEAILRDDKGQHIKTLKFPDDAAGPLARHRQSGLARGLGGDFPMPMPGPESLPAPGRELRLVPMWDRVEKIKPNDLKLVEVRPHEARREWPTMRPSDWAVLLARSYARHLCREYGAASAEIIRYSQAPISPAVLVVLQPETLVAPKVVANFGVFPR